MRSPEAIYGNAGTNFGKSEEGRHFYVNTINVKWPFSPAVGFAIASHKYRIMQTSLYKLETACMVVICYRMLIYVNIAQQVS